MIKSSEIKKIVNEYTGLKIGVLGSHSALEVMDGAKDEDIKTIVICQKGRDTPYRRFSRIADEIVVLNKFKEMASPKFQKKLREENTIIVPHRALTAYLGYKTIENNFKVPIFGNRALFQAEERANKKNQYYLLEKARIKHPRLFKNPKNINTPSIVKVQEKSRKLERAFFTVTSYPDYKKKSDEKIKQGIISKKNLQNSSIEELVIELQNIEVRHTPASIRESLLEKLITMGDKFVKAVKKEYPPGIIGPFSLQSVITKDLELVVYDVALRVPGNPIVATTSPHTQYQYGKTFGVGRRIAMELKSAYEQGRLAEVLS